MAGGSAEDGGDFVWTWNTRRVVAVAVVIAGACLYVASIATDTDICRATAAQTGRSSVTEVCGPLQLIDLVPFLVIGFILLLPDVSEIAFPGLGTVKLNLRHQAERQQSLTRDHESLQSQHENLEQKIATVEASLVQQASISQQPTVNQQPTVVIDMGQVLERLPEKERAFREQPDPAPALDQQRDEPPTIPDGDIFHRRVSEVLRVWEDLSPLYDAGRSLSERGTYGHRQRMSPQAEAVLSDMNPDEQALVARWFDVFREELEVVRAARNTAAHPSPTNVVDADSLREAISIGRRLHRVINMEIGEPPR